MTPQLFERVHTENRIRRTGGEGRVLAERTWCADPRCSRAANGLWRQRISRTAWRSRGGRSAIPRPPAQWTSEVTPLGCSDGADHPRVGWQRSCLVVVARCVRGSALSSSASASPHHACAAVQQEMASMRDHSLIGALFMVRSRPFLSGQFSAGCKLLSNVFRARSRGRNAKKPRCVCPLDLAESLLVQIQAVQFQERRARVL